MSSPININAASFEELKMIPGIGDRRAHKIIKRREEKRGQLTLEDLKMMSDIPNTYWDPLVAEGVIVLEPIVFKDHDGAEENQHTETKIKKMADIITDLQAQFSALKKDKQLMQVDFEQKMLEMNTDFHIKSKNKEHEIGSHIRYIEQKHQEEIETFTKESREREEQLQLALREKDYKLKLLQTEMDAQEDSKDDVQSAFSKIRTTSVLHKEEKTGVQSKNVPTYKSTTSERKKMNGPMPPKLGTYDGKNDWRPYFVQFEHIANRYEWSDRDRLDKLIECLRDRALKFFALKQKTIQDNYKAICKKMEERFGRKDLPNVVRRQLQELRQQPEETLDEYAERAQDLAADGYPNTPDGFIQIVATDAFLKGCIDKKAALSAMDKDPENLDKALQFVKSAVTNQRVIMGNRRPDIKRVTFEDCETTNTDSEEEIVPTPLVRTIYRKGEFDVAKFDARLKKTEDDLKDTKESLKKILDLLQRPSYQQSRSPQRSFSPQRSPVRSGNCYSCGEPGHFASECEQRRGRPPQSSLTRSRSPSPADRRSLNSKGLKA